MYAVNQSAPTREFELAWQVAGRHLQAKGGEGLHWLRTTLSPPLAEHLSFRIGNRLFFVYVDCGSGVPAPSSMELFLQVAEEAAALPAMLPMTRSARGYEPQLQGWGLRDAKTGHAIEPFELVDGSDVEMSDWEVHDFAIQVVRSVLEGEGRRVLGSQPSPHIDPSIWFQDDRGPAYVVVRGTRFPREAAERPANFSAIAASCQQFSAIGYFASVSVANADQPTAKTTLPLLRGHGLITRFSGLERV